MVRYRCSRSVLTLLVLVLATTALAQANGNLQLHFISVGQGDAALLISPSGQVVLFDDGVRNLCDLPIAYLEQLGVTRIDYHIASHYHDDHIGCAAEVLSAFPLQRAAYDRGGAYDSATFARYLKAVRGKRRTATTATTITLDAGSVQPVTIAFSALNGNGVPTKNENDLSLVALVRFGAFSAEFGGDLSGYTEDSYKDIETSVTSKVGHVDVYKVHHHGSRYSTNTTWLAGTQPTVAIISAGDDNEYGHPTPECLDRLHGADIPTYWTSAGSGGDPDEDWDVVSGDTIVQVAPLATTFTVTTEAGVITTYRLTGSRPVAPLPTFAWSDRARTYHYCTCRYVAHINAAHLRRGMTPPAGKILHQGCTP
jgi:beta-lactamase superfamily II metal-dependent hydrolase